MTPEMAAYAAAAKRDEYEQLRQEGRAEIVEKLNRGVNAALSSPAIKAKLAEIGGIGFSGSPSDLGRLVAEETEKWGKVIRTANIKPD